MEELKKYCSKIDGRSFDFQAFQNTKTKAFYLAVAQKGKIKNLFDLKTLKKDYANNGIEINIAKVGEKELKDYFIDWDAQVSNSKIEFWETGLILGYPIENTISLYKNGIK